MYSNKTWQEILFIYKCLGYCFDLLISSNRWRISNHKIILKMQQAVKYQAKDRLRKDEVLAYLIEGREISITRNVISSK